MVILTWTRSTTLERRPYPRKGDLAVVSPIQMRDRMAEAYQVAS